MRSSVEILIVVRDLADQHALWHEVERYGGRTRSWVTHMITQPTPLTTTQIHDLCFGAAISEYKLVNGDAVTVAATPWQRNLDRHQVNYHLSGAYGVGQDVVEDVFLELSPEEWCAVGMHGARYYIGGTAPAIQDIVNTAFRSGGWVSTRALRRYYELSLDTYGGSSPCVDPTLLPRWFSRIDVLTPWERLGCLYQLVAGHLLPEQR